MQITLLRHGRPTFKIRGWIQARDLAQMANTYEYAGICGSPPLDVRDHVRQAKIVVCSDLPRSIESAQALGIKDIFSVNENYRECSIPHFSRGSLVLPAKLWVFVLRVFWLFGFSHNGESKRHAKLRAKKVADHLVELAEAHQTVVLVGHGILNHFIAKELIAQNWRGPRKPKHHYWASNIYTI